MASRLFTADDTTKGKAIQTILSQSFAEYHSLCPEQEDPPFDAACSLFANMSTQLTSKAVIALNPDWLASAQSACKRLQDATVKCGKSWASSAWQSGGPDEVCERCKFVPGELQPILNLAKNHHILEDLKPIDDPPLSDLDKELPHLMRPVKKWMSVLSLQMGMIEEFYAAEIVQNVKDFHASVVNAIEKVIGMSLDHFIKVKPLLERLRLDSTLNSFGKWYCSMLHAFEHLAFPLYIGWNWNIVIVTDLIQAFQFGHIITSLR